jgi:crotonobetainyl-CoA:carnitine CoA-transferase CaiB-like acyl-CoA transferase
MPAASTRPFLPLRGVHVLSFEVAYSLPAGTRTLAELGAEVVRVAGPGRDSFYIGTVDGVYLSKECIGINLKDPRGLELAKELCMKADVICSNFVPGVMERLGLGVSVLRELNARAIVLELSGFGSPGPWSEYPAFGPSTEAAGGMNLLVGPEDGPPVRLGSGVFSDQLAGRFAALGIIAALEERQRTGQGKHLDLSMTEAISMLVGHTVAAAGVGEMPARLGNRDRDFVPQGLYPCDGDDEWLALSVKDDRQWAALVRMLKADGFGEGLEDATLTNRQGREERQDWIDARISVWSCAREKREAAERLQSFGIAAHAVQRNRDPLFDEHLAERGLFQMLEHERPVLGFAAHPHPTTPWFASGHARHRLRDAHFHGHDNVSVFERWLGVDDAEVRRLEREGTLIVINDPEVEDRRTGYRDADFAEQLGLAAELPSPPTSLPTRFSGRGELAARPLRVLEISQGPAGGFAGMLLALLGHEVTRVEPGPRLTQAATAMLNGTERAFLDRGKALVAPDGNANAALLEAAAGADVVIEDLGRGGLRHYGLSAHELRRVNPNLITVSLSPFGHTGPKSRWEASELTIQASAGVLHSTGWTGETPQKAGGFPAHYIAGIHAATAALARAHGIRAGTCAGGRIEVSMQETYIHHYTRHIGEWAYSGTKMRRERAGFGHQGFRHTAMAADGWIYVLSLYASWEEIALFFGLEDFLTAEWSSAEYRMEHWPEIEGPYLRIVGSKSRYE